MQQSNNCIAQGSLFLYCVYDNRSFEPWTLNLEPLCVSGEETCFWGKGIDNSKLTLAVNGSVFGCTCSASSHNYCSSPTAASMVPNLPGVLVSWQTPVTVGDHSDPRCSPNYTSVPTNQRAGVGLCHLYVLALNCWYHLQIPGKSCDKWQQIKAWSHYSGNILPSWTILFSRKWSLSHGSQNIIVSCQQPNFHSPLIYIISRKDSHIRTLSGFAQNSWHETEKSANHFSAMGSVILPTHRHLLW